MSQGNLSSVCTTKQVYLYLNTAKRNSGTNTNAVFTANNQQWTQDRMFNFRVRQINLPNEFYNVYEGANKLESQVGFSTQTIIIEPGYYTATELLDEVKDKLEQIHTPLTATYTLDNRNRVTWEFDTNIDFFAENAPGTKTDSFGRTLGFSSKDNTRFLATVPKGEFAVMLNRPNLVKVYLDLVEDHTIDNDVLTNLLDTISLADVEYGSVASRYYDQGTSVKFDFPEVRHVNSFRIRLTDQFDVPLTLPENFETSLFLVLGLNSV